MSARPVSKPDACSVLWEESSLPAAGTASRADFWVALEQTGPWGREASVMSHLDAGLGAELARACEQAGGRLLLIRRPGEHSDEHDPDAPRQVIVAGGLAGDPWLLEGEVDDPADLLTLPWDSLLGDDPDRVTARLPLLEETRDAVLLVCTNGKRDVCCAVRGRPVVTAAAQARPGRVWECSHTGGHRFAPTAITLPSGQMWGRLTADLAVRALDEEQRRRIPAELNDPLHNRGLSCLPPPAQAGEVVWRARSGELAHGGVETDVHPDALNPDRFDVVVRHRDGREDQVALRRVTVPELRDSCRKPLGPVRAWEVL
ncbi:hypothetical protein FB554_1088 [Barrientosiimonas humi]|uniref:Sucrase/ferredoxin-like protein n=1 Tax=Barrientosiimonas humi TaxID=999931 RepID=A0A542XAT1_9MICO|nr:sucrase ferredoxin [Barrientosiimonas humi]TQL32955.1 hypothetical protein FB554_1088 [Barrientosiimonas humi]CAG7572945.1 hypothetical protein BH39T_PBIAJDOK_01569 [Barrientosiimonas humi]